MEFVPTVRITLPPGICNKSEFIALGKTGQLYGGVTVDDNEQLVLAEDDRHYSATPETRIPPRPRRAIFHGDKGQLRQRYREGQEDQLSTLGLVVNTIALWNTVYTQRRSTSSAGRDTT